MKFTIGRKLTVGIVIAMLWICATVGTGSAYINYNPQGPDQYLDSGYQWIVTADTAANHIPCLRWAINRPHTWAYTHCAQTGTAADVWSCTIPDAPSNARIYYQFYKGLAEDQCDPEGTTWEWTPQHVFVTARDTVLLNRLNGRDPLLQAGLIGLIWVICGAVAIAWRHHHC